MRVMCALVFAWCAAFAPARAEDEPRIALVMGAAGYEATGWKLANPVRDAQAIAGRLRDLGFEVNLVSNPDRSTMTSEIREFGRRLRREGEDAVGLVYFSGHGLQADGLNFLIPVDAVIRTDADAYTDGVRLEPILRQMQGAGNKNNIIIIDACRDLNLPSAVKKGGSRGLARVPRQPNVLIAYSTEPGQTAADGEGELSPYTAALVDLIDQPEPAELMFKRVAARVFADTNGAQRPWVESGLLAASAAEDLWLSTGRPPAGPSDSGRGSSNALSAAPKEEPTSAAGAYEVCTPLRHRHPCIGQGFVHHAGDAQRLNRNLFDGRDVVEYVSYPTWFEGANWCFSGFSDRRSADTALSLLREESSCYEHFSVMAEGELAGK